MTDFQSPTGDLLRASVAAAVAAMPLVGAGDKNAVDDLAVNAMRSELASADFTGVVVLGEGEKDLAPMLFVGELIGQVEHADAADWDIAVDPIDGTALAAAGAPGAVSVIAAAERGSLLSAPEVYYMQKIVTGPAGRGVVHLEKSATENINALASALGKPVSELGVAVIHKQRNLELIAEIHAAGAKWIRFDEGDVAMAVAAALPNNEVDMLLGVGGNPEGSVTACAVQVVGGFMQGRLAPQTMPEFDAALDAGRDLGRIYSLDELAAGSRHIFVLSGITPGILATGVEDIGEHWVVQTLVLDTLLQHPASVTTLVAKNANTRRPWPTRLFEALVLGYRRLFKKL